MYNNGANHVLDTSTAGHMIAYSFDTEVHFDKPLYEFDLIFFRVTFTLLKSYLTEITLLALKHCFHDNTDQVVCDALHE